MIEAATLARLADDDPWSARIADGASGSSDGALDAGPRPRRCSELAREVDVVDVPSLDAARVEPVAVLLSR